MNKQKGFTLIELVVVIVILGILSAIALPKFTNIAGDARGSVIQGVAGSMAAANALIYARASTAGTLGTTGVPVSVTVNGTAVLVANGFGSTAAQVALVMDLTPATDFNTATANEIRHARAATLAATCAVTYTPATATVSPVYAVAVGTC